MKTKLSGILTLLLAFVVQFSFAQDRTITGKVSDETGPLPGVSVLIEGTTHGTETDFDGNYSLAASTGDIIKYSFVGMTTVVRTVGIDNVINVTMIEEENTLDEVVLTALGLEVKKEDDLSSSTAIEPDVITKSGESGLIQGLAGKTSGLKITKSSGDPGAGAYIQIRGQNTITGSSSPLIIIDGVPVSNTSVNIQSSGTAGVTEQSRLNDFNPEDIAKVTVLKGAAAAAVWGTGAANGAIIIQTKKGKAGKMSIDITSSTAFDKINVEFEKQGIYGEGSRGVWRENYSLSWGDKISDRSGAPNVEDIGNRRFESYTTGNVIYPILEKNDKTVYNQSNRDQVFGTGMTFNNGASISYSSEKSNTFMSFSNWTQDGIIKGKSNYKRNTLRLNHNVQLTDKFSAKFSTYYAYISSDRIQQGSNLSGLYLGYLRMSPDFDATDYKGTYYDSNNVPTQNSHRAYRKSIGGTSKPVYNNPLWTINEQDNPNKVNRFTIAPELTYKLTSNISLVARYGLDYYNDHRETFFPYYSAGEGKGEYYQDDITEKTEFYNVFAQGIHDINDVFNIDWILGTSYDSNQYARMSGESIGFTNPDVGDLRIFGNTTAENESPSSYKSETKKHGVYAVANFNLFNQLLVSLTGRYERPSTLENNVFYPSASIGWKFSELFGENDFLNFGKLRASYGEIGIEPGPYTSSTTYFPGSIASSWGDGLDGAAYGNPFTRSSTLGNPNLKEERVKEFEVGGDFRFFKDKINLGVTYYDRVTEDAILYIDVAPTTGYTSTPVNAAEITNKGLEIDLGLNLFRTEKFSWDINGFYSFNKNLVTDLAGVVEVPLDGFTSASSSVVEGEPMAVLMGNGFLYDDNGDYVLDDNGFPQVDPQRRKIGDPNPDWIGGLGTVLKFYGFTLSAQFETSQGNDVWAGTSGVLKYFGIDPETANESVAPTDLHTYNSSTIIPAGTTFRGNIENFGGGDVALTQNWYTQLGGGFGSQRESFVKDASWTRLRELSLGYTISPKLIEKAGLTHFEILLTGRNLFLWTDIEGFDPDLNLTGPTKGRGLDYFTNPATQSFIVTLKFGF